MELCRLTLRIEEIPIHARFVDTVELSLVAKEIRFA